MVLHEHVGMNFNMKFACCLLKQLQELLIIFIGFKNGALLIAPRQDMIVRFRIVYAKWSCHALHCTGASCYLVNHNMTYEDVTPNPNPSIVVTVSPDLIKIALANTRNIFFGCALKVGEIPKSVILPGPLSL